MSDATTPATHADWEDVDDISWTLLDREELVDAYWAVVTPAMEADGLDPDQEKPTHGWLRDHDFRPLLYALREYHNATFGEFWSADLELEADESGYNWATDHERTVEALESFLTSCRERKGLADSSIDTLRYRLNRYVAAYCDENETDDLVTAVARDGDVPPTKRSTRAGQRSTAYTRTSMADRRNAEFISPSRTGTPIWSGANGLR